MWELCLTFLTCIHDNNKNVWSSFFLSSKKNTRMLVLTRQCSISLNSHIFQDQNLVSWKRQEIQKRETKALSLSYRLFSILIIFSFPFFPRLIIYEEDGNVRWYPEKNVYRSVQKKYNKLCFKQDTKNVSKKYIIIFFYLDGNHQDWWYSNTRLPTEFCFFTFFIVCLS